MELCSHGHEEVCYEGMTCPACRILSEIDDLIGDKNDEIYDLNVEIRDLKKELEELKSLKT